MFNEQPSQQRLPSLTIANDDPPAVVLYLNGPAYYELWVQPYQTRTLVLTPGEYQVLLRDGEHPDRAGHALFHEYRRYGATFVLVPTYGVTGPLDMGEYSQPGGVR